METILIVDVTADSAARLARVLAPFDVVIRTVPDATSALGVVRQRHPALVVIDLQLPNFGGWLLAEQLNGDPHTAYLPLLAMTAAASPSLGRVAQQHGFEGCLTKPITPAQLMPHLMPHLLV